MAMHRQVAMMGCLEDHQTPRIRVKEDFSAVLVTGLGKGDEVRLVDDAASVDIVLPAGLSPFPAKSSQFVSFRKRSGTSPDATSVEIHRGS